MVTSERHLKEIIYYQISNESHERAKPTCYSCSQCFPTFSVALSIFITTLKCAWHWYSILFKIFKKCVQYVPKALQLKHPSYCSVQVFICSDSVEARQQIMELARHLNFQPVDMGTLSSSRDIENMPIQLFPGWKGPVLAAVALSIFFFAYSFVRDIIYPYVKYKQSDFYKIPMEMVNRTLPTVAITLLALVYLAGQLAAAHQLYYGTKYRHFPHWLEGWLQSRKQLGLLSFFLAAVHVLYSLCLPMRRSERYLLLNTAYQQVSGVSTFILTI